MVPTANLLAFSSKELCRKIPRVLGVVIQTTVAASVEVILCLILLFKGQYQVIQAALLGSMLANLLLCTGLCFCVGGLRTKDQEFSEALVETGGGLLLLSVAALMLPAAFYKGVSSMGETSLDDLTVRVRGISRYTSILLLVAYGMYVAPPFFIPVKYTRELVESRVLIHDAATSFSNSTPTTTPSTVRSTSPTKRTKTVTTTSDVPN